MKNLKIETGRTISAEADIGGEFRTLSAQSGRRSAPALLRALAMLFLQNPAPNHWEINQFQELMLNLLPNADEPTRQDLMTMLSQKDQTPDKVMRALQRAKAADRSAPKPHKPASETQQPRYTVEQLRDLLPLQISRKMATVMSLAAKRSDGHTLRTLLATHLDISREFSEHLLQNPDGFALAAALRALRMPGDVARDVLNASNGLHNRSVTSLQQQIEQFDRLDPEACRKRLHDWEMAFLKRMKHAAQTTAKNAPRSGHQPQYDRSGLEGRRAIDIANEAILRHKENAKKKA
ncbi:MAG: hypothetical protein ABJO09_07170 [Hyphomicrobiales bacterium]